MTKLVLNWSLLLFSHVTLVTSSETGALVYELVEEQPAGTFIADLLRDCGLSVSSSSTSTLKFSLLTASAHFDVDPDTGVLRTSEVIDRDVLCPGQSTCELTTDIVVRPVMHFRKVRVEILDINDNYPAFPHSHTTVYVSEATLPRQLLFPVQSAYDIDSPRYGVVGYKLIEDSTSTTSGTFQLTVNSTAAGGFDVRVMLRGNLDRERQAFYQIQVVAEDGGTPRKSGSMIVDVVITDVNDNSPQFVSDIYNVELTEDAEPQSNVVVVRATDPDAGINGKISYSLSARSTAEFGHLFSVDSHTGLISQLEPIDYEEHSDPITLHVVAQDGGHGSVPNTARVVINIRDVNDHAPDVRFETTGTGNDVTSLRVSENGAAGEFLAHMSVQDLDSGNAGRVHCTMPSSHFSLVRMYPNEYKIMTGPEALDRELQDQHRLLIICNDMGQPVRSSTVEIRVAVDDINDNDPVFSETAYNWTIKENNNLGDVIGRVIATDRDLGENAQVLYRIVDDESGSGVVTVNSTSGDVIAAMNFDRETAGTYSVRLLAEDGGRPSRTGYTVVNIYVDDSDDHQPKFSQQTFEFSVKENSPGDTEVGRVTADDLDLSQYNRMKFSINTSQIQRLFRIDSDSGSIYTLQQLDRETQSAYLFIVSVQSVSLRSLATATVEVTVDDVNDCSPTWVFPKSPDNDTVHVSFGFGFDESALTTLVAKDADLGDNAKLRYSISRWKDPSTGDNGHAAGAGFIVDENTGSVYINPGDQSLRPATTLYVTVQDGGRPRRSTSGQLTIIIDNYDVTAAARWRALTTKSVSGFLSLPLGGLHLAIIVAMVTATVLLVALIIIAIVVARRNRKRKYVVNGRGGNEDGGRQTDGETRNRMSAMPPQHFVGGMIVVDDVTSYDDVICCDENCSENSDVIPPPAFGTSWNYTNDINNDVMITPHGVYAAVCQQGGQHLSCSCHHHQQQHQQHQSLPMSTWSPGRSSLAASRPATLDRPTVRFSRHLETDVPTESWELDPPTRSPSFPPPPPPLAIASLDYAALYPQLI